MSKEEDLISVIIADDHHLTREGLKTALAAAGGFDVVAEAADGAEALDAIRALSPDVAILDVEMPTLSGVEVARSLRESGSKSAVLAISAFDSREYFYGLIDAGASGYLMKEEADADLIVEAVRRIAKDPEELWISPAFAGKIVRGQLRKLRIADHLSALTDREREILELVATGATNAEIGKDVNLSHHTVKNHVDRVKQKLDVRTRAELIAWAWERGLAGKDKAD